MHHDRKCNKVGKPLLCCCPSSEVCAQPIQCWCHLRLPLSVGGSVLLFPILVFLHPCLPHPSSLLTENDFTHASFVIFFFPADFSNVPEITTGLKRSQTEGTLDQVPHREKMEQTFLVRRQPRSQAKSQALVLEVGDIKRWTFSLPGSTS